MKKLTTGKYGSLQPDSLDGRCCPGLFLTDFLYIYCRNCSGVSGTYDMGAVHSGIGAGTDPDSRGGPSYGDFRNSSAGCCGRYFAERLDYIRKQS